MDAALELWLFFLVVTGVIMLPGLDMACVLASTLSGGLRAGVAATAGIMCGGVGHLLVGTLGITALLAAAPAAFNALLFVGAAYIALMGMSLLRTGGDPPVIASRALTAPAAFRRGAATSLLNPKAYLFMIAVFPQFIHPSGGRIWGQAVTLGLIIAAVQATVYGAVALLASRVLTWLAGGCTAVAVLWRGVGMLLILAAVATGISGWRSV